MGLFLEISDPLAGTVCKAFNPSQSLHCSRIRWHSLKDFSSQNGKHGSAYKCRAFLLTYRVHLVADNEATKKLIKGRFIQKKKTTQTITPSPPAKYS